MEAAEELTEETVVKKKGISGSTLKIIAIVAMLIDHIGAVCLDWFIKEVMPGDAYYNQESALNFLRQYGTVYYTDQILRLIGRFGFPLFVFLLVEGFTHTKHLKRYIRNLAIFALVSEIPFNLAITGCLLNFDYQNVFFTLLIGILTLTGIKYMSERKWNEKLAPLYFVAAVIFGGTLGYLAYTSEIWNFLDGFGYVIGMLYFILAGALIGLVIMLIKAGKLSTDQKLAFTFSVPVILAGIVAADLLNTDYSGWGVFVIVVMYYFRNAGYAKRLGMGALALTIMQTIEFPAFLMMIPVAKYNGKRGLNIKYFFYAFYPVHLFILYLITYVLGYVGFSIR